MKKTKLERIGIENFRVFKNENWFKLHPITIFTGTNNSGKSSLNKALLLLKHNSKDINDLKSILNIDFDTDKLQVGGIENVVNYTSLKKDITYSIQMKNPFNETVIVKITYCKNDENNRKAKVSRISISFNNKDVFIVEPRGLLQQNKEYQDIANVKVNIDYFNNLIQNFSEAYKNITNEDPHLDEILKEAIANKHISYYRYELKNTSDDKLIRKLKKHFREKALELYKEEQDYYESFKSFLEKIYLPIFDSVYGTLSKSGYLEADINIEDNSYTKFDNSIGYLGSHMGILNKQYQNFKINDNNLLYNLLLFHCQKVIENVLGLNNNLISVRETNTKKVESVVHLISYILSDSFYTALSLISNIEDISSIKGLSKRIYTFEDSHYPISSIIEKYNNIIYDNTKQDKVAFVNKWLGVFEIGEKLFIKYSDEFAGNSIYVTKNDYNVNIADLGYGSSQFVTILLKIATISDSNIFLNTNTPTILILEEPEINLHPALQSKLADLFIEANNNYGIQFILETHSEYLIRRLQYLTAKKTINTEDTIIYYLFPPESNHVQETKEQVREIQILPDGRLNKEFGPGFFDEADNLALSLFPYSNHN